jgi:hypothetical protein
MKGRTSTRGLSLLELLFTISLLTVVLVVFAAVYPSGYKLNRKSAKANVAVSTASAIAAEVQGLPFLDQRPVGSTGTIPTLELLKTPTQVPIFRDTQMRTKIPEGFRLPDDGISVEIYPPALSSSDPTPQIAYITVTIYWTDVNDMSLQRRMSVVTSKTSNQVGR